jgi:hypothetical protein
MMTKDDVKNALKNETLSVVFMKVNGQKREMNCTLNESVIPPASKDDPMSQKKVRKMIDEVCNVWDVDNSGWRSFRWENVISVNGEKIEIGEGILLSVDDEDFANGTK